MAVVIGAAVAGAVVSGHMAGKRQSKAMRRNAANIEAALAEWSGYKPEAMQAVTQGGTAARSIWDQYSQTIQGQEEKMLGAVGGGYDQAIAVQEEATQQARGQLGAAGQALMQQQAIAGQQTQATAREAALGGAGGFGGSASQRLMASASAQAGAQMGGLQANILGQQAQLSQARGNTLASLFTGRGTELSGIYGKMGVQRGLVASQSAGLELQYAGMLEGVMGRAAQGAAGFRSGIQHTAAPGIGSGMDAGDWMQFGEGVAGLFEGGGGGTPGYGESGYTPPAYESDPGFVGPPSA